MSNTHEGLCYVTKVSHHVTFEDHMSPTLHIDHNQLHLAATISYLWCTLLPFSTPSTGCPPPLDWHCHYSLGLPPFPGMLRVQILLETCEFTFHGSFLALLKSLNDIVNIKVYNLHVWQQLGNAVL